MPRFARLLAACLVLVAARASATVVIQGSVLPSPPTGFGIPNPLIVPGVDADLDNIVDWIDGTGNDIFFGLINPNSPTDAPDTAGLRWNHPDVWRDYDTRQNILVGDRGNTGTLTINGASALRYQHLILGGFSEGPGENTTLTFDTLDDPEDFILGTHLAVASPNSGGSGTLVVTGAGSLFNNDPNLIPAGFQVALNLGNGATTADDMNAPVTDLEAALMGAGFPVTTREFGNGFGYDLIVGLNGRGRLQVDTGGAVEVHDALMVAVDEQSFGDVVVDGFGSYLMVNGRTELEDDGDIFTVGADATSFVGGAGTGTMRISNGGRADFRNGLSIGAPDPTLVGLLGTGLDGSGFVTVTDVGSSMTVFASTGELTFVGARVALAVGQLNTEVGGSLADPILPVNADAQPGVLTIADGAIVTTSFAPEYATTQADANVAIGRNGQLRLRNGTLIAGNQVLTDGGIDGYGTLRASQLETSVYSVIRGGDDTAQNPALAEPLRVVLNGDPGPATFDALTNRGLIAGIVDIDAAGDVLNEGRIETGGELFARSLRTTSASRIVGGAFGRPLEIRLERAEFQANSPAATFTNLGLVDGNVNVVTPGGLVNGVDLSTSTAGVNGGEISATGVFQVGTFLNHRFGRVTVGAGESLSIVATADDPVFSAPVLEDGTTPATAMGGAPSAAEFFTANLGEVVVNGGRFEVGRSGPVSLATLGNIEHLTLFRNARHFNTALGTNGFSIGTVTANDAELVFRNGVYNTGVMAFTGGDSVVSGQVINAGTIDYNGAPVGGEFPGIIVVSGDGTTVTFQDNVLNSGLVSIGPYDNVVNFLGDYFQTATGTIQVAQDSGLLGNSRGAYIDVAGDVQINGGSIVVPFITAPATIDPGFSIALITAGELADESLFTSLDLPDLPAGKYWDVVYDTVNDEVRLEVVMSTAFGADFTGDGVVTQADVDVWIRNAGILLGASVIQGDADLDGDVDLTDYDHLMAQLLTGVPVAIGGGPSQGTAPLPEPSAALLVMLAAAPFVRRR